MLKVRRSDLVGKVEGGEQPRIISGDELESIKSDIDSIMEKVTREYRYKSAKSREEAGRIYVW